MNNNGRQFHSLLGSVQDARVNSIVIGGFSQQISKQMSLAHLLNMIPGKTAPGRFPTMGADKNPSTDSRLRPLMKERPRLFQMLDTGRAF